MAVSVHVPRINNNDDVVKLVALNVAVGDQVSLGQIIGSVETDKAVVDVESSIDGHVLAILAETEQSVLVGSVLMWLGINADDAVPDVATACAAPAKSTAQVAPTAKALALLHEYGIDAGDIESMGPRISADDVRCHVAARGLTSRPIQGALSTQGNSAPQSQPDIEGTTRPLLSHERGMLQTVSWQRDQAVPGYVELACDHAAWDEMAASFGRQHNLLLNPLLPLLAWRLVELAAQSPRFNATIVNDQRFEYLHLNIGFTVQVGDVLYLAVVRDAVALGQTAFVHRLVDIQRRAAGHNLTPLELRGATIGFSSMARWKVSRHVPILAPNTALMLAHTVDASGQGVLGATYDHRVLHGGEVAALLRKLASPPKLTT